MTVQQLIRYPRERVIEQLERGLLAPRRTVVNRSLNQSLYAQFHQQRAKDRHGLGPRAGGLATNGNQLAQ
ncbi:hypothetical protein [Aquincola tertiaricarbonis]|uniref:hypothetical protein n=1 Tax=Aquincola tertiaricarbonis TaxID=391953 RepID=UPI0012EE9860|nr:hypothetical protein [Aquincola tertiaricarbonis]